MPHPSPRVGIWTAECPRIGIAGEGPGAGASTLSVTLGTIMAAAGRRVGLLGSDTASPIVPNMLGVEPPAGPAPVERYGVRLAALSWMRTEEETLQRHPPDAGRLAGRALCLDWGVLDVLLVDLPPDPDEAAAIYAAFRLDGLALVATPRGAREGATGAALRRLGHRVLGVIENMSYYCCPSCGREELADGSGAVRPVADRAGVPWLGAVPISIGLRDAMADGRPGPASDWTGGDAAAFEKLTATFVKRIEKRERGGNGARICNAPPLSTKRFRKD